LSGTGAPRSFHSVDPVLTNVLLVGPTSGAATRFVFTRMRADVSRSALAGQSERRGKVLSVIYFRPGKLNPNRPIKKSVSAYSSRPSAPLPSTSPLPPTSAPPCPPPSAAWPFIGAACFHRRLCSRRLKAWMVVVARLASPSAQAAISAACFSRQASVDTTNPAASLLDVEHRSSVLLATRAPAAAGLRRGPLLSVSAPGARPRADSCTYARQLPRNVSAVHRSASRLDWPWSASSACSLYLPRLPKRRRNGGAWQHNA